MNNICITVTRKVYDDKGNSTPKTHAVLYCHSFSYSEWESDSWWKALNMDVDRADKGTTEHYSYRLENDDTFEVTFDPVYTL